MLAADVAALVELEAAALETLAEELLALELDAALDTLDELLALDAAAELLLDAGILDVTLLLAELVATLLTAPAELELVLFAAGALPPPPPPQAEIRVRVNAARPASLYCLFIYKSL